jgi:peroxiredoxin
MAVSTPAGELGATAPDFALPGVDGKTWSLASVRGKRGTVVAFICNHCPYVKAVIDRFVADAKALNEVGVGVVAIMPNDWTTHPDDSPDMMREFAATHGFSFPYLVDETQEIARAYGAVCTPDVFGFDRDLKLRYRGRIDSAGKGPAGTGTHRELLEAMRMIADSGEGPAEQFPSMGCSIKWRAV